MRFGGINLVAKKEQLLGFGRAGVLREQPGGTEIAAESTLAYAVPNLA